MKKSVLLSLMMGVAIFLSLEVVAMPDGDTPPNPGGDHHFAPAMQICAATFDTQSCVMYVTFLRSVDQAELSIYKDGILVEEDEIIEVTGGTTLSYPLYESGSYSVDLQIGDSTYHVNVSTI